MQTVMLLLPPPPVLLPMPMLLQMPVGLLLLSWLGLASVSSPWRAVVARSRSAKTLHLPLIAMLLLQMMMAW